MQVPGISIHAPRTGSDRNGREPAFAAYISIHAPRTGSDNTPLALFVWYALISIHAPRTGSDSCMLFPLLVKIDFNPRSPHGERHRAEMLVKNMWTFQSTLPARGATCARLLASALLLISIHAPRTGSDVLFSYLNKEREQFQSTLPARGATFCAQSHI